MNQKLSKKVFMAGKTFLLKHNRIGILLNQQDIFPGVFLETVLNSSTDPKESSPAEPWTVLAGQSEI